MTPWKKTFISAFIAKMFASIGLSFAMPFLPFFVAELGVHEESLQAFWSGVVLASTGLTFAIFSPVWGAVSDRFGRKLMLCRSMLGATVIMFLISMAQNVGHLVFLKLAQGALSGTMAASLALVASVVPHKRSGFALGMLQAATFTGITIGPFFGGFAADFFGYRGSFRIGALLCLLAGLFVYFGAEEKFERPDRDENPASRPSFKQIFFVKGFFIAVLVMFGVRFSNTMINPSFPLIVRDILPAASVNLNTVTGSIKAVSALAGALSAALLGFCGDKIGQRRILLFCCAGACAASLGQFFAHGLKDLFIARILFGLSIAGMLPAANVVIHSVIDRRSMGKAYGLSHSLSMLGAAFGPFMGGYVAKMAGLRTPFLLAAAGQMLLALVVAIWFRSGKLIK